MSGRGGHSTFTSIGKWDKVRGIPKMEIYILLDICKQSLDKSLKPTPRTLG